MQDKLNQAARILAESKSNVALTGAGISVESGIPAFRGVLGLWKKYDPMEYANIESFRRDPARVWTMLKELEEVVNRAEPNPAHLALADLERMALLDVLVTQNIDGLHQAAGSRNVVEFHGSGRRLVCLDCKRQIGRAEMVLDELPPRCACGGLIKPDVVFFGEAIPERALLVGMASAQSCGAMLVVGTSAVVAPASHLPLIARNVGAKVIEVNTEPSELTGSVADISLIGEAGQILPDLLERVKKIRG